MKTIKVAISETEDLISLNEVMMRYDNLNFDVSSGSINLDGKSIVGLLGLGSGKFDIRISGENHNEIKEFIKEIDKWII